jgi:hypothetical protein
MWLWVGRPLRRPQPHEINQVCELTRCFIFTKDDDEPPNLSFVFFSSTAGNNDKLKGSSSSYGFFLGVQKMMTSLLAHCCLMGFFLG